jgi:NADPH:quinone reductase-like Zn-dependent oxidoreductase
MKAIVFEKYGTPSVLELQEVEKPVPKRNEILIKVYSSSVGYGDLLTRNGLKLKDFNMPIPLYPIMKLLFGIRKPKNKILGSEISGIVEEIGSEVTKFKVGDEIFAYIGQNMRGNAEYISISEKTTVALKPKNQSFEEAGSTPYGSIMAYSIFERLKIKPGQKVLVIGASGGIGHFAIQFAKFFGANVTGVCSTERVELVKKLGAHSVIDYKNEDFTKNGEQYDIIFDVIHRSSFGKIKRSLNPNGRYVLASFGIKNIFHMWYRKVRGGKKILCMMARESKENLQLISQLIEDKKIVSIVDKTFPLEEASKAHQYIEDGHKKGQIVLTLENIHQNTN